MYVMPLPTKNPTTLAPNTIGIFLLVHARYVGYSSFATISCSPCGNALITHFVSLYIWEGKQQSLQPQGVGNPSCKSGLPIGVSTKSICY